MSFPAFQKKFNRGEISPLLQGDTSLPQYGAALRTCLNWLPTAQGALVRRPGSKYFASTKNNAVVKTLAFIFPDGRSYLLEFSDSILRFYRNGVVVGGPYELATPWTLAMLPYLKFAQVGNVVTITYGGQANGGVGVASQDLTHAANTDSPWTLGATPLKIPINNTPTALSVSIGAWSNAITYKVGDMSSQNNVLWFSLQGNNLNNAPPAVALNAAQTGLQGNFWWTPAVDPSHPAISVDWVGTFVAQDPNGVTYESGPSPILTGVGPLSLDRAVPISFNGLSSALPAGWTGLTMRLYRGPAGGLKGFIQEYPYSTAPFIITDQGTSPDYTQQPPAGTDPFLINGVDNFPAVITHFEQRRFYFRSSLLPMNVWGSKIGNLYRYDRPIPGADNDAVLFTIASEVLEEVRAAAPMRVCLVMTGMGEWTLRGSQGAAVTRSNVDMKRQSKWGSSWRDPIIVGNGILFNTAKNNMVRDLYPLYGLYTDVWSGDDISWYARHLFDGHTLVDWAYQSTPYSVIWAVRDDGVLLSLTYDHTREVVAWARHSLGDSNAAVENVAVVQEAPEDAVYFVVRRVINGVTVRYHERLSNLIQPSDVRLNVLLDASTLFDGRNVGATTMQLSGGTYLAGTQAVCAASTPQFAAADAGASSVIFNPDVKQPNGMLGVAARIVGFTDTQHITVEFDADLSAAQVAAWVTAATTSWALAKSIYTVTQLSNYVVDQGIVQSAQNAPGPQPGLRGVAVLGDASALDAAGGVTVVGTTVTLPNPVVVAVIGISYNSDVGLLDAYHPQLEIRNKFKTVVKIGFHVAGARGLWVGRDLDNLYEWQQRQVSDSYGMITPGTGYFEEIVSDDWNKDGSAALRQWEPLPCTLLGVLREMEIGGT